MCYSTLIAKQCKGGKNLVFCNTSYLFRVLAFLAFTWDDWAGTDIVSIWQLASIKFVPTPGARLRSSMDVNPPRDYKGEKYSMSKPYKTHWGNPKLTFLVSTMASALLRPTPTKVESSSTVAKLMSTRFLWARLSLAVCGKLNEKSVHPAWLWDARPGLHGWMTKIIQFIDLDAEVPGFKGGCNQTLPMSWTNFV